MQQHNKSWMTVTNTVLGKLGVRACVLQHLSLPAVAVALPVGPVAPVFPLQSRYRGVHWWSYRMANMERVLKDRGTSIRYTQLCNSFGLLIYNRNYTTASMKFYLFRLDKNDSVQHITLGKKLWNHKIVKCRSTRRRRIIWPAEMLSQQLVLAHSHL